MQRYHILIRLIWPLDLITNLIALFLKLKGYFPLYFLYIHTSELILNIVVFSIACFLFFVDNVTIEVRYSGLFIRRFLSYKNIPLNDLKTCERRYDLPPIYYFKNSDFWNLKHDRAYSMAVPIRANVNLEFENDRKIIIQSKNPEGLVEAIKRISNLEKVAE